MTQAKTMLLSAYRQSRLALRSHAYQITPSIMMQSRWDTSTKRGVEQTLQSLRFTYRESVSVEDVGVSRETSSHRSAEYSLLEDAHLIRPL